MSHTNNPLLWEDVINFNRAELLRAAAHAHLLAMLPQSPGWWERWWSRWRHPANSLCVGDQTGGDWTAP